MGAEGMEEERQGKQLVVKGGRSQGAGRKGRKEEGRQDGRVRVQRGREAGRQGYREIGS